MPLVSVREHYREQRLLIDRAAAAGVRARRTSSIMAAASLVDLQVEAAELALRALGQVLAEQGIEAPAVGDVRTSVFGGATPSLIRRIDSPIALARLFRTAVADSGRVANGVGVAARPAVQGYVRYASPPSCSRCAILAGRFYRWSSGFRRHPRCDCTMLATNEEPSAGLITSPRDAFERGQIRGLSKADAAAIGDGADIGRVVNIRGKSAGLSLAGRVAVRGGIPTPETIYSLAPVRSDAIRMLEQFGYIRT